MATEHINITDPEIHEPKGVAAAAANRVYVSNGAGSGTWSQVPVAALVPAATAFQTQLLHVRDQKTANTSSGTFTGGSWQTRTLNTVAINGISGASLSSNQITLPAGTYFCIARAPAYGITRRTQAKLANITDGTDTLIGSTGYCTDAHGLAVSTFDNFVIGTFTIAAPKTFALQHRCESTSATNGFGHPAGYTTEVYAEVLIWKVA